MKITLDELIEKTKFWWREEVGEGKDIEILMNAYMKEKGIKEEDIEVENQTGFSNQTGFLNENWEIKL